MIEVKGKFNTAKVFTDTIEDSALFQIRTLCDAPHFAASKIRIMPDVHTGVGCTIGTSMTITDKVVPGIVGVDIGCGMLTSLLKDKHIEFGKLDKIIRFKIPAARNVRDRIHPLAETIDLDELRMPKVKKQRALLSIGSLGGGNHFIEIDKDEEGALYLVVHSGSRNLGNEIAKYYQEEGYRALSRNMKKEEKNRIAELSREGNYEEIGQARGGEKKFVIPKTLAWVEGALFEDYIHDMIIMQRYAELNRQAMTSVIVKEMNLKVEDSFSTVHNYIDTDSMILRKGAVSSKRGERILIPINMRDGSLICVGKGNEDWNETAPHGAGRLMSRREARETLSMDVFRKTMKDVYTTSVTKDTIDESPMAYKPLAAITENIEPTVSIERQIKPLYNFKAPE